MQTRNISTCKKSWIQILKLSLFFLVRTFCLLVENFPISLFSPPQGDATLSILLQSVLELKNRNQGYLKYFKQIPLLSKTKSSVFWVNSILFLEYIYHNIHHLKELHRESQDFKMYRETSSSHNEQHFGDCGEKNSHQLEETSRTRLNVGKKERGGVKEGREERDQEQLCTIRFQRDNRVIIIHDITNNS